MNKNMLKEALQALEAITGPLTQFLKNLHGKNGELWLTEFKRFLRQEPCWNEIRKVGKDIILATDFFSIDARMERYIIAEQTKNKNFAGLKFPGEQSGFKNLNLSYLANKTKAVEAVPYRLRKLGKASELYSSFNRSLNDLYFTLDQLAYFLYFCQDALDRDGNTLFLAKANVNLPPTKENLVMVTASFHSKDMDHAQDYILYTEASPFYRDAAIGRLGDTVFIPVPIKRKNWLIRWSNWLAKIS